MLKKKLVVVLAIALSAGLTGVLAPGGIASARYAHTKLKVTADPSLLPSAGGTITLSATYGSALSCVVSASKPVSGLPATYDGPCGPTFQVVLPANPGKRALNYRLVVKVERLVSNSRNVFPKIVTAGARVTVAPNS
jgi:hypothetical protein